MNARDLTDYINKIFRNLERVKFERAMNKARKNLNLKTPYKKSKLNNK